jgi:hypothetical protein
VIPLQAAARDIGQTSHLGGRGPYLGAIT